MQCLHEGAASVYMDGKREVGLTQEFHGDPRDSTTLQPRDKPCPQHGVLIAQMKDLEAQLQHLRSEIHILLNARSSSV